MEHAELGTSSEDGRRAGAGSGRCDDGDSGLEIALGLGLIVLLAYFSTLSYTLRDFSRARLSDHLGDEERARRWLERLDHNESEIQSLSSFIRLTLIVLLCVWVRIEFGSLDYPPYTNLWIPAAIDIVLLTFLAIGIPHALAIYAGEAVLARSFWVIWGFRIVFYPVSRTLMAIEFVVRRLLGVADDEDEDADWVEQEILDAVSEGEAHGAVDEEQKEMIESIFELHETTVSEIMTPRTDMVAIRADATYAEVRREIIRAGHSRIPVYDKTVDHIIGVLYVKDLLRLEREEDFNLRKMLRSVPYVPESKTIDHLLREFRQGKVHIAIVLDEYGGTAGLVTIEDILEELVGEIDDEYDRRQPPAISRIDDHTLEVDARVPVYEVNEELEESDDVETAIPEDGDYETVGGFVFTQLGKIPAKDEEYAHKIDGLTIRFRVVDAEPRRIKRLRIEVERAAQSV